MDELETVNRFEDVDWPSPVTGRRILVVNPLRSYWSLMFCAEAALRAREEGAEVFWVDMAELWTPKLSALLEVNESDRWRWFYYRDPLRSTRRILSDYGVIKVPLEITNSEHLFQQPKDLSALRSWRVKDLDLGAVVHASVSGRIFKRYLSLDDPLTRSLVDRQMVMAAQSAEALSHLVDVISPDTIFTTNDRVLPAAVALMVARKFAVESRVFYWGSRVDTWISYRTSLYSHSDAYRHMSESWLQVLSDPVLTQERISEAWNWRDSQRDVPGGIDFTSLMRRGQLPEKNRRKRAVFYASSPWEFTGTLQPSTGTFADQREALRALITRLDPLEWEMVLRHHPAHPTLGDVSEAESWNPLRNSGGFVEILPTDPVDSMELARSSDLNIVWNSSIGVRIAAEGLPVLVCGPAYWAMGGVGTTANSYHQLQSLDLQNLKGNEIQDLYPVINYLAHRGSPFRFAEGLGSGLRLDSRSVFRPRYGSGKLLTTLRGWFG